MELTTVDGRMFYVDAMMRCVTMGIGRFGDYMSRGIRAHNSGLMYTRCLFVESVGNWMGMTMCLSIVILVVVVVLSATSHRIVYGGSV